MSRLNRHLRRILMVGWILFALAGVGIRTLGTPSVVVAIDRSYCPPAQWKQVSQDYETLFLQARQGRIQIQQVILFTSLGEDFQPIPPIPSTIRGLTPFGKPDPQQADRIRAKYPHVKILQCPPS